jgi:hypothetical protein
MSKSLAATIILSTLAIGCNTPVVFTTHTSLGLDVSGTAQLPNKVSFSYNRFEGSIIPRKTNGEAHSVYGGMDADMSFFSGQTIKQTFATGKAAMLATHADTDGITVGTTKPDRDALVFLTSTTFGLHLTSGEQQMAPNLLLGYRRAESAMIPVPDPAQEVRSVYADILINTATDSKTAQITTNFSALRGVRIKQCFATGRAAEAKALTDEVQAKLAEAAGIKATKETLAKLHETVAETVKEIQAELDRLDDDHLPQAVAALKASGVLSEGDLPNPLQIPPLELRGRLNKALDRQADDETSDQTTLHQLKDSLARIKQIHN